MAKAAFALLWCFVLVLPWDVFLNLPVLGSIPRIIGLIASAVGVLYVVARQRVRRLQWFHLLAGLFVLWAGVSSLWSIDAEATRTVFFTYLQLVVFAWLIWEVAWSPARQRALLQAYVLGASIAALVVIRNYLAGATFFTGAPATEIARFAALNQDPNELGLTIALGLPMAWYVSLSRELRAAWLWRFYLPLAVPAILLTGSRGSVLSALVGLSIIPWTLGRLRLRAKLALYALVAASLVLASQVVPEASLARIASTRADVEAGYFGGRGAIWLAGLEVARDHPLVGVGAGGFEEAVEPTIHQEMVAHNVFLSILVEDGLVGLVLFVAMILATLLPLRHLPLAQRRFSAVLLLALAVGSLSLSWGHRKQFWFVLGVLAAQAAPRRSRDHRFTTSPPVEVPERPYPFSGT
jgi:O-antigen ligase